MVLWHINPVFKNYKKKDKQKHLRLFPKNGNDNKHKGAILFIPFSVAFAGLKAYKHTYSPYSMKIENRSSFYVQMNGHAWINDNHVFNHVMGRVYGMYESEKLYLHKYFYCAK